MSTILLAMLACAPEVLHLPTSSEPPVTFGFPIDDPAQISQTIGVDHDPEIQPEGLAQGVCTDFDGRAFPHCYDEHRGSDYILDGGFDAMDAGSVAVLAAAPGTVVDTEDGNYDRCHTDGFAVGCDGHEMAANYVIVEHLGGLRTMYWHLMSGSVAVAIGDAVACGDELGLVGSSGYSSMPHLHFQVEVADGAVVDPYAGPHSQDVSLWQGQGHPATLPEPGCTAR